MTVTCSWSEAETLKLIEVWGDENIQNQLEGCKRNKTVYEKVSQSMSEAGFEKSADQCREKAKKLKNEYRMMKDKHRKTGEGRKEWKFLNVMDNVLTDKPSTCPSVLIDTLENKVETDDKSEISEGDSVTVSREGTSNKLNDKSLTDDGKTQLGIDTDDSSTSSRSCTPFPGETDGSTTQEKRLKK